MSKKKNKFIPKLRFPEFKNEGEWEYVYGDELFEPISNKDHNSDLPILAVTQEQGAVPRDLINYHVSVTDKSIESYKMVEIGDFIISLRSFQGGIEFSNYLGLCSPAYIVLRKKEDVINDFYRHYFKSYPFIQDLNKNLEGIRDGKMISYKQFSEILIPKPKIKEQEKIAACLSSLDEVISAYNEQLDLLKVHKKGLMQNLFPQEGEKMPKYRFKEFINDGNWIPTKLGDVADFINGRAYNQEELLSKGKYRVLRVGNFFTNNDWYYSDLELDEDKYCEKGDLLYAWSASFGPHIWNEEKVIYHYHIWKVKNKQGVDRQFLYNLLDYETFRMKAKSLNGFALMHITKGTIENWESIVPKSQKEQQKIASCLFALDNVIASQAEFIEQLKLFKNGLLQSLFPKTID